MLKLYNTQIIKDKQSNRRQLALFECSRCKTRKEGRADMKQTTSLCRSCSSTTHGLEHTKLYSMWLNMKARCYTSTNSRYYSHGARGITVIAAWRDSFETFADWAFSKGYVESSGKNTKHQLDREDNDKNYNPDNCRLLSQDAQMLNRQLLQSNNSTGFRGVSRKSQRFVPIVRINGKNKHFPSKSTARQAAAARELIILTQHLPLQRNFPDMTIDQIQGVMDEVEA